MEVLRVKFIGIHARCDYGSNNKADGSTNENAYD